MNTWLLVSISALVLLLSSASVLASRYGERLCDSADYYCIKIERGDTWNALFPDAEEQDIIKRVNRLNVRLRRGMILAIPENLANLSVYDIAPFPRYIEEPKEKTIYVSQDELAWGAYDASGELIWWGPASVGRNWCSDIGQGCQTPEGNYRMIRKQGVECESSKFPIDTMGGAPMPYCMHFFRGFALHGSPIVPGYAASHGCVRLFLEDAKWLNEEFIDLFGSGRRATRVIIGPPPGADMISWSN